jgi:hypothetical protein
MNTRPFLIFLGILILAYAIPALAIAAPVLAPDSVASMAGTTVTIPLSLMGAEEPIGNMDLTLSYDPLLLQATEVRTGDLTNGALIDSNIEPGSIRIGIVSREGFRGNGTVALVSFMVRGTQGSSSLRIEGLSVNHADTLAPLLITTREGTFTILSGIRFDQEGTDQRVTVDLPPAANITLDGDRIILTRPDLTITLITDGLTTTGSQRSGLVQEVLLASPPVTADLSFGPVTGRFEFSLPRYPLDGYFSLSLAEGVDPGTLSRIQGAAGKRGLEITSTPFSATITTRGYGKTGPATGYFTIPNSLLVSQGGIDAVWFGHVSDYVSPELLKPAQKGSIDSQGRITLRVDSPDGLSIFVMASAKMKAIAHPDETPSSPQSGLILFGNMIVTIATLSTGNLIVGAITIGILIAVTVGGIFYVHRRRGG